MIARPLLLTDSATPVLDYAEHDKGKDSSERVAWSLNINCPQASAEVTERGWEQLVADAPELKRQAGVSARGRPLRNPYGHYLLSWHPDDNPSREHIVKSVKSALKSIGLAKCEARIIVHSDTEHIHAHIVVCRVNPESGRTMGNQNDLPKLQRWALQYRKSQGKLRCSPGLLDELRIRDRARRQIRAGLEPSPLTPDEKARRQRRKERRTERLRAAGAKRTIHARQRRVERDKGIAAAPVARQLRTEPARPQVRGRALAIAGRRPAAAPAARQLRAEPARPRVERGRALAVAGPAAAPVARQLRTEPARPQVGHVLVISERQPAPAPAARELRAEPARPEVEQARAVTIAQPAPSPAPRSLQPEPERYGRPEPAPAPEPAPEPVVPAPSSSELFVAAFRHRENIREAGVTIAEATPRGVPWNDVEADLTARHATGRYTERVDGLDVGLLRTDLETQILDEARQHRSRTPPVRRSGLVAAVAAVVKSIREATDRLIEMILEEVLPNRPEPAPAQAVAPTQQPAQPHPSALPAPRHEAAPVRAPDEKRPGSESRPSPEAAPTPQGRPRPPKEPPPPETKPADDRGANELAGGASKGRFAGGGEILR